jgi:UDP-glucose 4-epimerase
MRVLITGGMGFIGRHLSQAAITAGAEVTVLDDASSPAGAGSPPLHSDIRTISGSVLDRDVVARAVTGADLVFHLAAIVGVHRVLEDPLLTLAVNTDGASNVLHAAAAAGAKVVYTSSSEVYGAGDGRPFSEDDVLHLGPAHISRWSYAVSKLHGEMLGLALAQQLGLRFVAARMFNVVGPGQRADQGMVLPRFVEAALAGQPLTLDAPGTQQRSLLHVTDAAALLWKLGQRAGQQPVIVNVGSPHIVTMRELADQVVRACHSASPIVLTNAQERLPAGFAPVNVRVPDLSRLQSLVGPLALQSLQAIVADTVAAYGPDPRPGTTQSPPKA